MMSKSILASFALLASCLAACSSTPSTVVSDDAGGNDATVAPDASPTPDSSTDAPVVVNPDAAPDAVAPPADAQSDVSVPADSGLDSGHD